MQDTKAVVGFNHILELVAKEAQSTYAKDHILNMQLSPHLEVAQSKQAETAQAKALLEANLTVPFMGLTDIDRLTQIVEKGLSLEPHELVAYADFLRSSRLIKAFLDKHVSLAPILTGYAQILGNFTEVEDEIYKMIKRGKLVDEASRDLKKIRKQIAKNKEAIDKRLEKFMRHPSNKDKIQEPIIVEKAGRMTIPVKSSYKRNIAGSVVSESSKGLTVYIEPDTVKKLTDEQVMLEAEETSESYQILAYLTGLIYSKIDQVYTTIECIVELEVILARAKYSRLIKGRQVRLNKNETIHLKNLRTPLIPNPVPLTLTLDGGQSRGLVITGANAGGKTVVLKTVALVTYMAMAGLLISCDEGTEIAIFDQVFVEIGDNQSIERSLSTFSSHMQSLALISQKAGRHTLVLLDEIGSGTEPREGTALAIAIMNELYQKAAMLMVTTHYGEVKRYANEHPHLTTAAMDFDIEKLAPTYQLMMNETGDSQAFVIAQKMAISPSVMSVAKDILDQDKLPIEVREFDKPKNKLSNRAAGQTSCEQTDVFQKGDRVYASEFDKEGLFYEMNDQRTHARIFIEGEWYETLPKRLNVRIKRADLYPENYDLERLFMDYDQYKYYHDLYRGSKKAWKNQP